MQVVHIVHIAILTWQIYTYVELKDIVDVARLETDPIGQIPLVLSERIHLTNLLKLFYFENVITLHNVHVYVLLVKGE